jgi:phosphate transport system substrate-binding protein
MWKIRSIVAVLTLALMVSITGVFAQDKTIADVATEAGTFNTLLAAADAAGLTELLSDPAAGPFTVFAPTDEAFAALPQPVLDYLLAPENKELLTRVLTYHVISGKVLSADVTTMAAPSLEMTAPGSEPVGSELAVVLSDEGAVTVNGANVVTADIEASNGVVHVIDTVLIPEIVLEEVDPLAVSDNVIAAGSSTVYPVAERVADLFLEEGFAGTITVDSVGTGAGFERFCTNAETDIATASRKIKQEEADACIANGREPFGLQVGIDALAVVVSSSNTFVDNLTSEDLAKIYSGEAVTWADVNAEWPAEPIQLFSPGTDSGTFDYFVEHVFAKDREPILNAAGIQLSEDDNVLVAGVEGSEYAIGYFGFAYYLENQDKLRAVSIDGVAPTAETAESNEYPLSRPLFLYTASSVLAEKPQVAAFLNYFLTNINDQLGTEEGKIGYFPAPVNAANTAKLTLLAETAE